LFTGLTAADELCTLFAPASLWKVFFWRLWPALALEPPRRFEPGALPAQPVGRERRRRRFDMQRQIEFARRTQQRSSQPRSTSRG
jgi:hypothetical protein